MRSALVLYLQSHWVVGVALCGLLLMLMYVGNLLWQHPPGPVYVYMADLVSTKQLSEAVYDDAQFSRDLLAFSQGVANDPYSPNPPSTALIVWVIGLHRSLRGPIWVVLNLLLLCAVLVLSGRAIDLKWSRTIVVGALALLGFVLSPVLTEDLQRGQIYLLLAMLHALLLWSVTRQHDGFGAIALAGLILLKMNGWPIWLTLIALKRWRLLTYALGLTVLGGVMHAYWFGIGMWQTYFLEVLPRWLRAPWLVATAYQTVSSFCLRLLQFDLTWNPYPLVNAPGLARGVGYTCTLALLCATLLRARSLPAYYAVCSASVLSVILSPTAEQYHFLILLPAVMLLIADAIHQPTRDVFLLLLALVLLSRFVPFKTERFAEGGWALLAYPRLYAALIVNGLCMSGKCVRHDQHDQHDQIDGDG